MEQYLPIIISLLSGAAGGNIAGKILKSGMGTMGRSVTGIVGGAGLGFVMQMMGIGGGAAASGVDAMSIISNVVGGGVGGGILTAILGMVTGKK